jgi:hypothetical protein
MPPVRIVSRTHRGGASVKIKVINPNTTATMTEHIRRGGYAYG